MWPRVQSEVGASTYLFPSALNLEGWQRHPDLGHLQGQQMLVSLCLSCC